MQEVKKPKKPLIFYYVIVLLVLLLFNFLAHAWLAQRQIQEVDYGTFMDMAAKQELGQVEVQEEDNQILFTDKDETTIYKTGMMPGPRPHAAPCGLRRQVLQPDHRAGEPDTHLPRQLGTAHRHLCGPR